MQQEDYVENLFRSIDTIIAERIKNIQCDFTEIVEVVDISSAKVGKYKVSSDNQYIQTVQSDNPTYQVGDKVLLLHLPKNKYPFIIGLYLRNDGKHINREFE